MTVMISGSNGFIGSHLMQVGFSGLVRSPKGRHGEIFGDITQEKTLRGKLDGIETLIHCAGIAENSKNVPEELMWLTNYQGTKHLILEAARAGVKHFIFMSSIKAMITSELQNEDGENEKSPNTAYGNAKLAAEKIVLEIGLSAGMHVVVLRPAMVYGSGSRGNLEKLIRWIHSGWFPILPNVENRRSALYIDDLICAVWLAVNSSKANGKTYLLAHPQTFSTYELCQVIRENTKRPLISWSLSSQMCKYFGAIGDGLESLTKVKLPINSEVFAKLLGTEWCSPEQIHEELGWTAKIDLNEGMKKYMSDLGLLN